MKTAQSGSQQKRKKKSVLPVYGAAVRQRLERVWGWFTTLEPRQGVLLMVGALICLGFMNIYSATMVENVVYHNSWISYVAKQAVALLIGGVVAARIYYKMDYHKLRNGRRMWVLFTITVFILVLVLLIGPRINGAKRWIPLMVFSFQPSEFAKLFSIIWASVYLEAMIKAQKKVVAFTDGGWNTILNDWREHRKIPLGKWVWLPLVSFILIMFEPDLGTAVLAVGFPGLIAIYAGLSLHMIGILGVMALVVGSFLVYLQPYRMDRVLALYDPWSHAGDIGYQAVQSMIAVGTGGFFGESFGQGTSKYFFLPEAHTDFAFAVWSQEWGFFGDLLVIFLLVMLLYYGLKIAVQAKDLLGRFLAFGITTLLGVQAVYNMLMAVGSAFVTGVPFPFLSYGGSALIMNMMAVGILLQVAKVTAQANLARGKAGPLPSLRKETQSRYRPQG